MKKTNANVFMLTIVVAIVATAIVNVITFIVGLPALVMCSFFLLCVAGIAVMVEQKQWILLAIICIGMCIIVTGISWQAGLTL